MKIFFKAVFLGMLVLTVVPVRSVDFSGVSTYLPTTAQLKTTGKVVGGGFAVLATAYVAAQLACGNSLSEIGSFFLEGLKHPTEIGTFSPCSKYLGQALCAKMPKQTAEGHLYLEAGAGTGIVSEQILAKMAPNDHLVLAEFVPELAEILRKKFAKEIATGRVSVVSGDVCEHTSARMFDYIFTTIPFNAFDLATTKRIWGYFLKNLTPGGGISYVNYRFFPELRKLVQFGEKKKNLTEVNGFLNPLHVQHGAGFTNVNRNVPPIRVRYFKFAESKRLLTLLSESC